MESLRGHTTGYAVPQFVIDAPAGGGKVPINPEYVLRRNDERVIIRNFEGKIFEYPEAPDGTPLLERVLSEGLQAGKPAIQQTGMSAARVMESELV